ncbi:MAG: class I SAM-dependent methyltransferase [candidate division WOR-3 bacterium]
MKNWWKNYFDEIYIKIYSKYDLEPERIKREVDFIEKSLELKKEYKILDLCCGYGRHAIELAKRDYNVTGLDYSKYFLKIARERARKERLKIKFIKGDMRKLNFYNEFDIIYNFFTSFGYFEDKDNFNVLKRISKALKKNGKILIDTINPFIIIKSPIPKDFYFEEDLLVLEERKFDPVNMRVENLRIIYKDGKKIDERSFSVRVYTPAEISFLLEFVGIKAEKFYGSLNFEPFKEESRRLIVIGIKL